VDTETVEFIADEDTAGERLDRFLARRLGVSRSRVSAAIREGLVTLDGAPTSPDKKLRGGERVKILALAEPEPLNPLTPREAEIGVLYEDSSVVVVDKPAGLVVHPAHGHADDTLLNALAARGIELAVVGDGRRPGVVHRLDMDTSGVLVLAKTQAALLSLVGQFSAHTTGRVYWALIYGVPEPPEGTIEAPIGRHPRDRKRFAVVQSGRPAVTHYRVLESLPPGDPWAALVECRLETGRTHQVRVHLAHRGHPLLGDEVYGTRASRRASAGLPLAGHALHARMLAFDHPESGERLSFTSDPPPAFTETLELLRGHGETATEGKTHAT
jgi:23S rRNA pseudouridine1911/1915/1917 synthase